MPYDARKAFAKRKVLTMAKKNKFRLDVSDREQRLLDDMMDRIGAADTYELFINAAVLLMWAIRQREHGRKIASIDPTDEKFIEFKMTIFNNIKQQHSPDCLTSLIDESGEWILFENEMK